MCNSWLQLCKPDDIAGTSVVRNGALARLPVADQSGATKSSAAVVAAVRAAVRVAVGAAVRAAVVGAVAGIAGSITALLLLSWCCSRKRWKHDSLVAVVVVL